MTVEIRCEDPVALPGHREMFELVAEYMHGDADVTTFKKMLYQDNENEIENLKRDIEALIGPYGVDLDDEGDIEQYFKNLGYDDDEAEELTANLTDNFREYDRTAEGNLASFCGIKVFYYDYAGVKHHTSVAIDGKAV